MGESRAWGIPTIESESIRDPVRKDGPPPGTELSDVEVIRVLEARPRIRVQEPDELPAAARRPVVHELVLPTSPDRTAAPKPSPVAKPAAQPAPVTKPREERDSLAETLNELRKFAFDLESDDTGSTTGVRHLQVELDQPSNSRKSRGPRR